MLKLVYEKARKILPRLPLDCTNKHWILPSYLAYFQKSVESMRNNSNRPLPFLDWHSNRSFIGYPDREAEFHIIYNYFYKSTLLTSEILVSLYQNHLHAYPVEVSKCPGFYELLPKRKTVDKMVICHSFFQPNIETFIHDCYCANIMQDLQQWLLGTPTARENRKVSQFIADRMGWNDTSPDGDVRDKWPFYFLYKKVMDDYKSYKYIEILNEALELNDNYYYYDDGM